MQMEEDRRGSREVCVGQPCRICLACFGWVRSGPPDHDDPATRMACILNSTRRSHAEAT
jgi:hypothetical protein